VTHVRFDKRGNPYVVCDGCGARTFLKNMRSLRGFALHAPLTAELLDKLRSDAAKHEQAEQTIAAFFDAIRSRLDGARRAPITATAATLTHEAPNALAPAVPAAR
jgi:predicted NBD/HSP70 family sugar kinase